MSRLAANNLGAGANTTVYTAPANTRASVTLSLCNRTSAAIAVRVALQSGALGDADYLEYDQPIPANTAYERSGIILANGQILMVRAAAVGVSAVVYGVEEQV